MKVIDNKVAQYLQDRRVRMLGLVRMAQEQDIETVVSLAWNFYEYNLGKDYKRFSQGFSISSRYHKTFLAVNDNGKALGYYSIDYPCPEERGTIKLDQFYVDQGSRGNDIGYLMLFHLMDFAAQEYAMLRAKKVKVLHFREKEDNIENLRKIRKLLHNFGFSYRHSEGIEAPRSELSLTKDTLKYLYVTRQ